MKVSVYNAHLAHTSLLCTLQSTVCRVCTCTFHTDTKLSSNESIRVHCTMHIQHILHIGLCSAHCCCAHCSLQSAGSACTSHTKTKVSSNEKCPCTLFVYLALLYILHTQGALFSTRTQLSSEESVCVGVRCRTAWEFPANARGPEATHCWVRTEEEYKCICQL